MPRCARVKSFDSIYHVMVRSISDTPLFRCSTDKDMYVKLISKYQGIFLFILSYFGKDFICFRKNYFEFVKYYNNEQPDEDVEFAQERAEYRSERTILVRNAKSEDILEFVSAYIKKDKLNIHIKYIRDTSDIKSLSAFLMRELCDMKQKDICKEIGNVTQPHAAKLCLKGFKLINEKEAYKNIVKDFLIRKVA